ncbi:hypothetical protein L5I17_04350 [Enterococcus faecalis]|nr:hypothetical protein [Enterococcus faecalis]MDF4230950.1 hypothetical protein [Enterococcus faecalis]UKV06964.1 hypothetical protein L5I17_04350 [Enterococcus faecalis]
MSKKAVWLSDIEFIEMHSSDWERNHMNKTNTKDGEWRILKYGRPITLEF